MKRNSFLLLFIITSFFAASQPDSLQPPYKRFPGFPPAQFLLPDSITYYSKKDLPRKSPVLLMLFSPSCEHCRHETEEIVKNIDRFRDIQIVMVTFMPFDSMIAFRQNYRLAEYKNIVVAKDVHFFLPPFFNIRNLPFMAFYNKKKELISVFEGGLTVEKMLIELEK